MPAGAADRDAAGRSHARRPARARRKRPLRGRLMAGSRDRQRGRTGRQLRTGRRFPGEAPLPPSTQARTDGQLARPQVSRRANKGRANAAGRSESRNYRWYLLARRRRLDRHRLRSLGVPGGGLERHGPAGHFLASRFPRLASHRFALPHARPLKVPRRAL